MNSEEVSKDIFEGIPNDILEEIRVAVYKRISEGIFEAIPSKTSRVLSNESLNKCQKTPARSSEKLPRKALGGIPSKV